MSDDSTESVPEIGEQQRKLKITVEIPCLLLFFAGSLCNGVTPNLLLYRTCMNDLHYNSSQCDLLLQKNKTAEAKTLEDLVQGHVTLLLMTLALIAGILPAILSLFLGGWSDKHGRKPLIVMPIIGLCISTILQIIYCALPTLGSWWFLICIIPFSILGGVTTISLGANLLITDTTTEDNRSFRLSVLQGCYFTGLLLGTVSSSYVYEAVGYMYVFVLTGCLQVIALIYVVTLVGEPLQPVDEPRLRSLFNSNTLKQMLEICTKNRPPSVAIILTLLIAAYGLTVVCINGLMTIEYLFTREKFNWLLRDYTIFSGVGMMIMIFGMIFGMSLFQKVCGMPDGVLLVLAYVSGISDPVMRSLARQPWHMYLAASTSILSGLSLPLIRSNVARIVPADDVGKIFSLISCVEAVLPVCAPTLFSTIYYNTLTVLPGAIYMVSAGFNACGLVFVITAEILKKRSQRTPYLTLQEEPTTIQDVD